jgi:O-antigen ligase
LCYAGYCIGYTKYESISDIGKSRILKVIVIVLAAYVGMYPFLSDEIRLITMRPFFAPATDESSFALLYSPRFPGLGINANIWAFMNLILLIFVLKSTLERKITWIYVFLILIIIIITASKTVLFLSIISIITQIIFYKGNIQRKINILLIILPIIIGFSTWLSLTDTGKLLQDQIVIAKRISYIFESTNVNRIDPVEDRKLLWAMGIERVELSPFLGISKSTVVSESYLPYFSHPHNEFIAIWMFMGIIGLLSVIILIFGLIHKNFLYKNWPFWINIYIALVFQMFFDAAFQSTRFLPLFFIIVGLNLKELYFLKNNNIKI